MPLHYHSHQEKIIPFKRNRTLSPGTWIRTDIPTRLDSLPWSRWHWKIVFALGITWLLDGLEVTLVGAIAGVLIEPSTLHLSETQVGASGSAYLAGAVFGSLLFGRLADRWGRKRLFFITLGLYLIATLLTAFSWNFISFALFRALTGAGIGGESSAMASAIDELIPARIRGGIDLAINSTYWLGTAAGAAMSLLLLDANIIPHSIGWRLCFGIGALVSSFVLLLRKHIPESPRWLLNHGKLSEANRVADQIEEAAKKSASDKQASPPHSSIPQRIRIQVKGTISWRSIFEVLVFQHPKRALLGVSLIVTQAFAYNAIFFTYALVLVRFYGIQPGKIGLYLIPFAIGNFLGPLTLGRLFDTVGRKIMITVTYGIAGVLLAITGFGFAQNWLTATSQTVLWCIVFFVASAAASSAYLTVGELFPVEMRSMAIALFYAIGTAVGGVGAPALLGAFIETGNRWKVAEGYFIGAGLLILGASAAWAWAVPAEGKSLEMLSER